VSLAAIVMPAMMITACIFTSMSIRGTGVVVGHVARRGVHFRRIEKFSLQGRDLYDRNRARARTNARGRRSSSRSVMRSTSGDGDDDGGSGDGDPSHLSYYFPTFFNPFCFYTRPLIFNSVLTWSHRGCCRIIPAPERRWA
jgi:hypothetical protein